MDTRRRRPPRRQEGEMFTRNLSYWIYVIFLAQPVGERKIGLIFFCCSVLLSLRDAFNFCLCFCFRCWCIHLRCHSKQHWVGRFRSSKPTEDSGEWRKLFCSVCLSSTFLRFSRESLNSKLKHTESGVEFAERKVE